MAPARRRRRSWFSRRRSSRRGRFELAIVGGGAIALAIATILPGSDPLTAVVLLSMSGALMTFITTLAGFIPALAAAVFAPIMMALTDPMWTLGATFGDFTLGSESEAAFGTFVLAAILGAVIKRQMRRHRNTRAANLWRTQARPTPVR